MSDYDRSKNLGTFLHKRREPVEADEPAAERAESPTIGSRMVRLREASKMRPRTEGEKEWVREQSERSSEINATRAQLIGRRG